MNEELRSTSGDSSAAQQITPVNDVYLGALFPRMFDLQVDSGVICTYSGSFFAPFGMLCNVKATRGKRNERKR